MKVILLAAGKGSRIYNKIKINKCLIKAYNKTLIENILIQAKKKLLDVSCVTGFNHSKIKKALKKYNLKFIHNKKFASTDMLYSAILGIKNIKKDDVLIVYTDTYFHQNFLKKIFNLNSKELVIPVSSIWKKMWKIRKKNLFLDAEDIKVNKKNYISTLGDKIKSELPKYQYMGVIYIPSNILVKIRNKMIKCYQVKKRMHLTNFVNFLIKKKTKVKAFPNSDYWYEFDDYNDLIQFKNFYEKKNNFNY